MIRSVLFRYDERFGILASRELIEAAVETNNNRRQGFFERPLGRALLTVAASFLPGGQYVGMALNAGFSLHDGAGLGEVLRNAAISYFASTYGDQFGALVARSFGGSLSPAVAAAIEGAASNVGTTAIRQILSGGRLTPDALLLAALSGGAGGAVTSFVANSDLGRALDQSFGAVRASDVLGRLTAAFTATGRLDLASIVSAFSASAPAPGSSAGQPFAQLIETNDGELAVIRQGNEIYTLYDDGSVMLTYPDTDGSIVVVGYDADGNIVNQSNLLPGTVMAPNDGPQLPVGGPVATAEPDPDNFSAMGTRRSSTMPCAASWTRCATSSAIRPRPSTRSSSAPISRASPGSAP